jgi:hypothetical protein
MAFENFMRLRLATVSGRLLGRKDIPLAKGHPRPLGIRVALFLRKFGLQRRCQKIAFAPAPSNDGLKT